LTGQIAKIAVGNGTTTTNIDVPVLKVFPYDPMAVIKLSRDKTVLITTAEDRSRTSRIKDKGGLSFEEFELQLNNMNVTEENVITAFFDEHYPGVRFIVDEKVRTMRRVGYFNSPLDIEEEANCAINISFRFVEG
jgi:hypothetical protein